MLKDLHALSYAGTFMYGLIFLWNNFFPALRATKRRLTWSRPLKDEAMVWGCLIWPVPVERRARVPGQAEPQALPVRPEQV
ncbi:MAG: hypothetical protein JWO08_141 [Verrucomicrobiaceae bacterium]|nr:hypothetical protein [Verrucomicrobiaceae bacterium]